MHNSVLVTGGVITLLSYFAPLPVFANPSGTLCHLVMPRDTAGERVIPDLLLPMFSNPSVLRTPPLYFALQNTGEEF